MYWGLSHILSSQSVVLKVSLMRYFCISQSLFTILRVRIVHFVTYLIWVFFLFVASREKKKFNRINSWVRLILKGWKLNSWPYWPTSFEYFIVHSWSVDESKVFLKCWYTCSIYLHSPLPFVTLFLSPCVSHWRISRFSYQVLTCSTSHLKLMTFFIPFGCTWRMINTDKHS